MNIKTSIMLISVLAAPAFAQDMDHSEHGASGPMADYMETMDVMAESMANMGSTDDADAAFLLMMIPHHQSAIDMAEIELEQGDDEETRQLAQQIIEAQEREIADMKAMLDRLGVETPE